MARVAPILPNQHSYDLSVLSFNVAGLPWPVSQNRAETMTMIGHHIRDLLLDGEGVDVVLIQEGFIDDTETIADILGFSERITGAGSALSSHAFACGECLPDTRQRKWWKGEGIGAWAGSGLHIFSAYPIVGIERMAFGETACAGYDCLANKGAVLARIILPGAPHPVDVITTHLNSTNAADVPKAETHFAHERQVRRLADFWIRATEQDHPAIIGGDFNIRGSHERFVPLAKLFQGAAFVKNTCQAVGGTTLCEIDVRPDAPWLTSQDLQAFRSGHSMTIKPVVAKTVLDHVSADVPLSDHFGFLVRYRLEWQSYDSMERRSADAHLADQ